MKISYLLTGFGYTGGSVVLYNFMDRLVQDGHEVYAVTPTSTLRWEQGLLQNIPALTEKTKRMRLYSLAKSAVKKVPRLETYLKRTISKKMDNIDKIKNLTHSLLNYWIESDITISTHCTTAFAGYTLMDKTKVYYHMQHYEELFYDDPLLRLMARATYFLPIRLIANSTWLQTQIKRRFNRDSYLLTPGVSTEIFRPYAEVDEKYTNGKKINILSYCDKRHFKGWEDAVEAMKIVYNALGTDKVNWTVYGGYQPGNIGIPYKHAGKLFGVNLAKLYSQAHITFMSSWYESFPLPPLEAMACGTAVVTTRLGTEDYAFDGKNSLVVEPRKPQKLAEAIITLAKELEFAKRLAKEGLITSQNNSWNNAGKKLEPILKDIRFNPEKEFIDIPDLVNGVIKFS